jgi:O-antigen ligase
MTNTVKSLESYLFGYLLVMLFWLPLPLGSNRDWSAMLLCIMVAALSIIWLISFSMGKSKLSFCFKKSKYVIFLLIISQAFIAYQYLFALSIEPEATLKELFLGISFCLFFCLCLLLINSTQRVETCLYVIVLSGVFQAVYGSLMTLTGVEYTFLVPKEDYLDVATGTFVNRNSYASYLVICLSLGIGLMIAGLQPDTSNFREFIRRLLSAILNKKIILRLSLVIMVAALVMTHSRMGNTSFFVSMGVIGTLAILLKKRSSRATLLLLTSLIIIDIAVIGTFFGVEKVINRLESTSLQSETRDEVDQYTLNLVEQNIILGTGAGTFHTAFPQVRQKESGKNYYDHAHNDYLQFLSERGLIGFIPLFLSVIITFGVALSALKKRNNTLMRGCAFGCLMSMLAMAIHVTVDFNLQMPANGATFMLVLALGWIARYMPRGKLKAES